MSAVADSAAAAAIDRPDATVEDESAPDRLNAPP